MRRVTVLGATGSIGHNAMDVIATHPDRFRVQGLSANTDVAGMFALCKAHRPAQVVMVDHAAASELASLCAGAELALDIAAGAEALDALAADPGSDSVVAGVVGVAGLPSALAAARAGKRVLIANKEVLVVAGPLFMNAASDAGAELVPVDSEHNAILQCLPRDGGTVGVRRVLLTASGGPFLDVAEESLASVTPDQACAHPNWEMGRKISVDSATMMNKGLEIIEACVLFGLTPRQIEVLVHPQSIVHSLVEYIDGSVLAQLGSPDMRIPIAHALGSPDRISSGAQALDLVAIGQLGFQAPDLNRFPCLGLAMAAAEAGGAAPVVLNAADEVAVAAFLEGRIGFGEIAAVVEETLAAGTTGNLDTLEGLLALDGEARRYAEGRLSA
jgi:1-deoxy-D-xylulose-5-phosphate reductoisomerase